MKDMSTSKNDVLCILFCTLMAFIGILILPSCTTGKIFLYVCLVRRTGSHRTNAHARNLRATPTRHVYFAL